MEFNLSIRFWGTDWVGINLYFAEGVIFVPVEITDKQFNEWDKLLSRSGKGKKNKDKISNSSTDEKQGRTCTPLSETLLYIGQTENFALLVQSQLPGETERNGREDVGSCSNSCSLRG